MFRRFPGTEFATHLASGSAEGWVELSWDDGPRETAIRRIGLEYHGEHPYRSDQSSTQDNLKGLTTFRRIGVAGQRAIDAWFREAHVDGFERFDPAGNRPARDRGYDMGRTLTRDECTRLRLPKEEARGRPTVGLAINWYHMQLDFTGHEPVFDDSEP
ncbi:hypothetical protein ACFT2C_06090 [Promicromonospora sp. NPDC057138]|uniref:hypothetical protein n=1 Tax=Promicromonospora sp. NPDC057138 TaxID=3346031 RepID=UPI003632213D